MKLLRSATFILTILGIMIFSLTSNGEAQGEGCGFSSSSHCVHLPMLYKADFQPPTAIPTQIPTAAIPNTPSPKVTPKPDVTVTCSVSPSTISGAYNTPLTFYVIFSPPTSGYGFSVDSFQPSYSGQRGCSGVDGDRDGYASCTGSSGMLPYRNTVRVKFSTSAGTCYSTYQSR